MLAPKLIVPYMRHYLWNLKPSPPKDNVKIYPASHSLTQSTSPKKCVLFSLAQTGKFNGIIRKREEIARNVSLSLRTSRRFYLKSCPTMPSTGLRWGESRKWLLKHENLSHFSIIATWKAHELYTHNRVANWTRFHWQSLFQICINFSNKAPLYFRMKVMRTKYIHWKMQMTLFNIVIHPSCV